MDHANTTNESTNSAMDLTESDADMTCDISQQELLYGKVMPTPSKQKEPASLPPLHSTLHIPKKRSTSSSSDANRIFSTPQKTVENSQNRRITPSKSRNFTSPVMGRRVISITDSPIPNLSPATDSIDKSEYNSINKDDRGEVDRLNSASKVIQMPKFSSPTTVRNFSSPSTSVSSTPFAESHPHLVCRGPLTPLDFGKEYDTSIVEESDEFKFLTKTIRQLEAKIQVTRNALMILTSDSDTRLRGLVEKWRDAAQMSASYLHNEALKRISRMGGLDIYRANQRESELKKLKDQFDLYFLDNADEYMHSTEFENMPEPDRIEFILRKEEMVKEMSKKLEEQSQLIADDEKSQDEYTMWEFIDQLNKDYYLIYPMDKYRV
ncbi:hypothetical protein B5S28_g2792 [[Candida] boidinii]|nr:hypothetical protein B5S28_g2792 [[Candida] boidinii]